MSAAPPCLSARLSGFSADVIGQQHEAAPATKGSFNDGLEGICPPARPAGPLTPASSHLLFTPLKTCGSVYPSHGPRSRRKDAAGRGSGDG